MMFSTNTLSLQKCYQYYCLMRFDRPVGSYLLLWPVLSALWLASGGLPDLRLCGIFVIGVFVMRAAGSVVNDIADHDIDGRVERTKDRPLAKGTLSLFEAALVLLGLLLVALFLATRLNMYTAMLAPVGLLTAVIYPLFKRFFPCPQLMLGLTWSWGILMAFSAVQGSLSSLAWLLYLTNFILTVAYDTMYAMGDREDDLQIGLHSSAILFGRYDRLIVAIFQLVVLIMYGLIAVSANLAPVFFLFLAIAGMLMVYQQFLIKDYDRIKCLQAFKNNNYLGLAIWLGIVVASRHF